MKPEMESEEERDAFFREVTTAMAAGSEAAYQLFFNACFDKLYRHLLVQTHGREDLAQELAQIVLVRTVRYAQPFQSERMLWAWLRQVARTSHVDWLRRHAKEPPSVSLELFEENLAAEPEEPADEELLKYLENTLETLNSSEREIIRLAYFEDVPQRGMAERLGTTPKAIESRLGRIRQKLRVLLLERLKNYALL
jgi:RNA polymerase sigma-70 factor (ECF subfamily)